MAGFEQLGEELIHDGPVFRVTTGQVRSPDGEVLTREYVRHPGAVVVVPVVGDDVVLVSQYRAAIDRDLVEIPAGKRPTYPVRIFNRMAGYLTCCGMDPDIRSAQRLAKVAPR